MHWLILAAVALMMVLVFMAGLQAAAWVGGWATLARHYRATEPFHGWRRGFQDAQLRYWCGYGGCVTVGGNSQGLYLACLFRFGHPPLLVPWEEVAMTPRRWHVELRFARAPDIPVRLRRRTISQLLEAQRASVR